MSRICFEHYPQPSLSLPELLEKCHPDIPVEYKKELRNLVDTETICLNLLSVERISFLKKKEFQDNTFYEVCINGNKTFIVDKRVKACIESCYQLCGR